MATQLMLSGMLGKVPGMLFVAQPLSTCTDMSLTSPIRVSYCVVCDGERISCDSFAV
jgi:hypothetical protein